MKNTILTLISITTLILLSGCGGGGSTESPSSSTIVTMSVNSSYTLSDATVITKTSDANISIVTDLGTNVTTATLISGGATCTECTLVNP